MGTSELYRIRPAGRHILTIGRDLVQDRSAAIIELVKNAYDADSPDVSIQFKVSGDRPGYSIIIEDRGHGMSRNTVVDRWMVPSTDDKVTRRLSPGGRTMQGQKGIGRYAAAALGKDLLLETVDPQHNKTTVLVDWTSFENARYLDDVPILIETDKVEELPGTRLTITDEGQFSAEWSSDDLVKLENALKKLASPVDVVPEDSKAMCFDIYLTLPDSSDEQKSAPKKRVETYPLIESYDYRVSGQVQADGKGSLIYSVQKSRSTPDELIPFDLHQPTECGDLSFDIRVYDREGDSIESLVHRGQLKDGAGNYLGRLEARNLLNSLNGIGVYRNGFRIRPLGDPEFDWLKLNDQRIQNPSLRIGSNQVIGYVQIQAQLQSGLIEKSARDGLYDNKAFDNLKSITNSVIRELEARRFAYRRMAGLSKPAAKIEKDLQKLYSFDQAKRDIRNKLATSGVDQKVSDEIIGIVEHEEEEKNRIVDDVRQAVAVYQGQATLGKIINVILHEGRRPLNYFRNQIPNMEYWLDSWHKTGNTDTLEKIDSIARGIGENADVFVKLFGRLDPLATGKRSARVLLPLRKTIAGAFSVFHKQMADNVISVNIMGPTNHGFLCWPQDIYAIFVNLIDNSIYWMIEAKSETKEISVDIVVDGDQLQYIEYRDTGPGINPTDIASEVIFEPQYTTKPEGTGLGLAIAGEAASRNGLELMAFESESGAHFRLQPRSDEPHE